MSNVEIKPINNEVDVLPTTNRICLSLFDVYTTSYYLTESMILEDHKEVGEPNEL